MKKIALFVATLTIFMPFAAVLAMDSSQGSASDSSNKPHRQAQTDTIDQRRAEAQQKKTEQQQKKCERVAARVDQRIAKSTKHKATLLSRYAKVVEHINAKITKSKERLEKTTENTDVEQRARVQAAIAKLEADLSAYQVLVDKLKSDFDALAEAQSRIKELQCTQLNSDGKNPLKTTQAEYDQILADRAALHEYWKSTLRPDFVALLKALSSGKPKASESSAEPSNQQGQEQ